MTASLSFINFAYGSNMSTRRLRARTPSAKALGVGRISGHRLAWHKLGQDGSAKCDIHETGRPEDCVWGVLYEIAHSERFLLDRAEGLGRGYEFKTVEVRTSTTIVTAGAYYATQIADSLLPYDWYHAFVLGGADEHGLPEDYRAGLRSISVDLDPDAERRRKNFELLNGLAR